MKNLKTILTYFSLGIWAIFLTLVTQVGGVIWLLSWAIYRLLMRYWTIDIWQHRWVRWVSLTTIFLAFYVISTLFLVPTLAEWAGKRRLPDMGENAHLQPANRWATWLNRNYVLAELHDLVLETSEQFGQTYAGATVTYLDGGFPLGSYPLFPHRTHTGKQIDIAFCYLDAKTDRPTNEIPSATGYGIFEPPKVGETNTCDFCKKENPDYDMARYFAVFNNAANFKFDLTRSRFLCGLFAKRNKIGKIYIEPHLEQRLGLASFGKVRFHGCQATRHDDHFHVEIY